MINDEADIKVPPHYAKYAIQPIQLIAATEHFDGFCVGNIIKLVVRFKNKGGFSDLLKAQYYIDSLVAKYRALEEQQKN